VLMLAAAKAATKRKTLLINSPPGWRIRQVL